jgi:hypothetical protein
MVSPFAKVLNVQPRHFTSEASSSSDTP